MFNITAQVLETGDNALVKAIKEAFAELADTEVLIGIPDEANGRQEHSTAAPTNAELMFIHTHGSPINGIPARPILEPAIMHHKEQVSDLLKSAADAALRGDKEGMRAALEKAGRQSANLAQDWFTNTANGWDENFKITVEGGWMKNKKTGKVFKVKGKGSSRPLIDSGQLRKAITYTIRKSNG